MRKSDVLYLIKKFLVVFLELEENVHQIMISAHRSHLAQYNSNNDTLAAKYGTGRLPWDEQVDRIANERLRFIRGVFDCVFMSLREQLDAKEWQRKVALYTQKELEKNEHRDGDTLWSGVRFRRFQGKMIEDDMLFLG